MRRALSIDRATLFVIAVFLVLGSSLGATFAMGEPATQFQATASATADWTSSIDTLRYPWAVDVDLSQSPEANLAAYGIKASAEAGRVFGAESVSIFGGVSSFSFVLKQFDTERDAQQAASVLLTFFAFLGYEISNYAYTLDEVSVSEFGDQQTAIHGRLVAPSIYDPPHEFAFVTVRIGTWVIYADASVLGLNPLSELVTYIESMGACIRASMPRTDVALSRCLPTFDEVPPGLLETTLTPSGPGPAFVTPTPTPMAITPTPTPYVQQTSDLAIQGAGNAHLEVHVLPGTYELMFLCTVGAGSVHMWLPIKGGSAEIQSGNTNQWVFTDDVTIVLLSTRCDTEWTFTGVRTDS